MGKAKRAGGIQVQVHLGGAHHKAPFLPPTGMSKAAAALGGKALFFAQCHASAMHYVNKRKRMRCPSLPLSINERPSEQPTIILGSAPSLDHRRLLGDKPQAFLPLLDCAPFIRGDMHSAHAQRRSLAARPGPPPPLSPEEQVGAEEAGRGAERPPPGPRLLPASASAALRLHGLPAAGR